MSAPRHPQSLGLRVAGARARGLAGDGLPATRGWTSTELCQLHSHTTPSSSLTCQWRAAVRACHAKHTNQRGGGSRWAPGVSARGSGRARVVTSLLGSCCPLGGSALSGAQRQGWLSKEGSRTWCLSRNSAGSCPGGRPGSEPGTGSLCTRPAGAHGASSRPRRGGRSLTGGVSTG